MEAGFSGEEIGNVNEALDIIEDKSLSFTMMKNTRR